MIRSFLNGTFQNTAFCLLAPDGKKRLSRSGRAPWQVFGKRGFAAKFNSNEITVAEMEKVAKEYEAKGDLLTPVVQDFHSFRQALNVASGDQRLLLFVSAATTEQEAIRNTLSTVVGDPEVVGRFHVDLAGEEGDEKWSEAISGVDSESQSTFFVIQSDKFGQKGTVLDQLVADASAEDIKAALLAANEKFAGLEKRKVYSDHVAEGKRERVQFDSGVEYGEDRDGDGEIDRRGGRRKRGGK